MLEGWGVNMLGGWGRYAGWDRTDMLGGRSRYAGWDRTDMLCGIRNLGPEL